MIVKMCVWTALKVSLDFPGALACFMDVCKLEIKFHKNAFYICVVISERYASIVFFLGSFSSSWLGKRHWVSLLIDG